MKVLFIFPPGRGFRIADKKTFPINPYSPPLGILYLSTILERNGHEIDVLDLTAENIDENKLKTKISWADAVGMAICTSSLNESRKLGEFIRNCDNEKPFLIGHNFLIVPHQRFFSVFFWLEFQIGVQVHQ